jgi:hypothetical protein
VRHNEKKKKERKKKKTTSRGDRGLPGLGGWPRAVVTSIHARLTITWSALGVVLSRWENPPSDHPPRSSISSLSTTTATTVCSSRPTLIASPSRWQAISSHPSPPPRLENNPQHTLSPSLSSPTIDWYLKATNMSEDVKSVFHMRRKPRLLVVSNPDDADADDRVPEEGQSSFPPFNSHPTPPSFANKPFEEISTPPRAPAPPPLTTNLPPATLQYPSSRPNQSNQSLSSPSSTSSRAFESTPPPSTPGQSNPPDEISSEGTLGQDGVLVGYPDGSEITPPSASSRKGFMHKLRDFPKHKRRTSSNRPQTVSTMIISFL